MLCFVDLIYEDAALLWARIDKWRQIIHDSLCFRIIITMYFVRILYPPLKICLIMS